MALKSIRWRLPLSYAGIALFSVLALGLVFISILRSYYNQQERASLIGNAKEIAFILSQEINSNTPPSTLKNQISSWSFLLQARLQYLDKDGKLVFDSGIPENQQKLVVSSLPEQGITVQTINGNSNIENNSNQTITNSKVALPGWGIFVLNSRQSKPVPGTAPQIDCAYPSSASGNVLANPCPAGGVMTQAPSASGGTPDNNSNIMAEPSPTDGSRSKVAIGMTMSNTIFGFDLNAAGGASSRRSSSQIVWAMNGADGSPIGAIILSDGLAFGDEIVSGVTIKWLFASLIAVLLAAAAGWWVSRLITAPLFSLTGATQAMVGGNLSARVKVQSKDEFGELSQSFNTMASQIEEIVGTLRGFVADAAHQLMTPLTALRTNLELASDELNANRRIDYLSSAKIQTVRMETLVNGLLELSRLEANGFAPAQERFDLHALAHEVAEAAASRAEQAGLQFNLDLPQEAVPMDGDQTRIRHALENLLDNAIKYTPSGGSLRLRLSKEEHGSIVAVEDSGRGISAEDLPHVFERFHRGRNSTGIPGSGLGLAIVKAIVEMHHGKVSIDSTHQGTKVELRFNEPKDTFSGG